MSDKNGIEIDYCPECRGVWLDRGELEKIVDRMRSNETRDHRDHDDHSSYKHETLSYDQNRYPYRRKKSDMFDDLFDIFD
jgi:Zn-finger nucleic acid-binding protein